MLTGSKMGTQGCSPANGGPGQVGASRDMAAETAKNPSERRLNSWKEIAAFVGRDERTVKRWEQTRGLPVRRLPGTGHVYVFAYVDEINAWLNGRDSSPRSAVIETHPPQRDVPRRHIPQVLARATVLLFIAATAIFAICGDTFVGGSPDPAALVNGDNPSPMAAQLYRAGLHEWQSRTPSSLASAISDFNQAIKIDPRYAEAYVGLANAYNLEGEFTSIPPDRLYPQSAAAARRAIALDPSLAGAHAALAFTDFYWLRDVASAGREFRRALALDPKSATAHHWYAAFLMTIGNSHDALIEIDKAEDLDSESNAIPADKGIILFHAGEKGQAVKLLTQLEQDQPGFAAPHRYLATIWLAAGDDAAYLRELRLSALARHDDGDMALAAAGAAGLARGGHLGMLHALLADQQALYAAGKQSAFRLAATFVALHDTDNALTYIAASISRHEPDSIALKVDPPFDRLRNDPRFVALMARAGLDSGS
jgi:Tfp pilus assembly protein PilF